MVDMLIAYMEFDILDRFICRFLVFDCNVLITLDVTCTYVHKELSNSLEIRFSDDEMFFGRRKNEKSWLLKHLWIKAITFQGNLILQTQLILYSIYLYFDKAKSYRFNCIQIRF